MTGDNQGRLSTLVNNRTAWLLNVFFDTPLQNVNNYFPYNHEMLS